MTHFEAVEVIASRLTNQIVISNVGNTNRELYSVKKHKLTLYGVNMSLVTPLAFGLAKAIPQRKVIALDGDGSILMGLKTLATVGTHPANNLLVLVLDNGCYAACGWYPTAAGRGVDVAYDGVGGATLQRTLGCVRPFGVVASIGQSAGPIPPIDVADLGPRRSLALARPSVMAYMNDVADYRRAAERVLTALAGGALRLASRAYRFHDAAQAQADLEAGRTTGALYLQP